MKKLRVLRVSFDVELSNSEIPAFRSAIIEKVGKKNLLFHHHLTDTSYLYKYPLIQYKNIRKQPTLICIGEGVDEIHKYFEKSEWDIEVNGRKLEMKIARLDMNQFNIQVWDKLFRYSIVNWVALNQENYQKYLALEKMTDKIAFLERTLKGNIISFAKGIGWDVDKQIDLNITNMRDCRLVKVKDQRFMGFNLDFSANVFLPDFIGLGKSVSKGFGTIKSIRD
ncbi:MAG: hypothetical protein JW801_06535 [Bacteroidales bacterium]|nr:hypothetical protein [Bacteroidales bacterium]